LGASSDGGGWVALNVTVTERSGVTTVIGGTVASAPGRMIQVELERSATRDRFEFVTRWAAEPLDLLRELRRLRPTVVHFAGHGASASASP